MVRQGKYTKRPSFLTRLKRQAARRTRWFRRMSLKKQLLIAAVPVLVFLVVTPLLTYAYYARDISNQERLMNRNNTGVVLLDKNDKVIYSAGKAEHRDILPLDKISKITINAAVASEDKDFYDHDGFSITGIVRAFYGNLLNREITGGGSTITQQLAKNTLLSEKQTLMRKYQELAISVAIESKYTKDQIMEMYLNSVFFGGSVFGIDEAAEFYFSTEPANLNLAQSAMLIGILPAPNAYSPTLGNPEYAKERQRTVLDRMVKNGFITKDEADAAYNEELSYATPQQADAGLAPHFTQMVLAELYDKYGEEKVTRSGYQVKTTLDLDLQKQLKQNITDHLSYIEANGGSNAAGVAIDPDSGDILALVGSADWDNEQWGKVNMVTSKRQPGSSFKPIYYSAALGQGVITPATILHDKPTDFGGGYRPLNADRRFRGDVTVRSALSQSLNIPSVEVMQEFGVQSSIEAAEKLGITTIDDTKQYGLSLALGSAEVPLLEMTNAYAAFANEGQQFEVTSIREINNKFDASIFRAPRSVATAAISPGGAYLISNILSDNSARAPIFGGSLTVPGRTAAVKTGTTDDQRDAWTIGYTPQLAVGVWVGNNDNAAMLNGGSGMAGPIWVATMRQALANTPDTKFVVPAGIVQRAVCIGQEALATRAGYGTYNEYFLSSALPTKTCTPIEPPKPKEEPKDDEQDKKPDDKKNDTGEDDDPTDTTDPTTGDDNDEDTGGTGNDTGSGSGTGTGSGSGTGGTITPQDTTQTEPPGRRFR